MDEQEEVLIDELDEALIPEEDETQEDFILATVAGVTSTGVKLEVDGSGEAGDKEYRVNSMQRFRPGDRVKICKNSGTYIVEYKVGAPMADYPIPSGGTDGQVLTKDGSASYAVKWSNAESNPLPTGGTAGQVLTKINATNYSVQWADVPHELPTGGTTGQVLTKNAATNYSVQWSDAPHGIPSGGTDGQALLKNGSTNYSVKWGTPSVETNALVNGSQKVTLTNNGLTPTTGTYAVALGTSSAQFNGCYIQGAVHLSSSTGTLSFFGATGARRQTVANTATVATLITALKAYGLIY